MPAKTFEQIAPHQPLPEWLRKAPGSSAATADLKRLLRRARLHTVCEEARCPNISECFSRQTATFMILGDVCTRTCRFCSVQTGRPHFPASDFSREAKSVAEAALQLGLRYVVVTSVARDDLQDGGASGFIETIRELRRAIDGVKVEVLIPDFRGNDEALAALVAAGPDVINHNLETVPRLYRRVRPGASYQRSLHLLRRVKELNPGVQTKTGIMLGLGERREEVAQLLADCRAHQIDLFTAGQYMRPTRSHLPVEEYVTLDQFACYREMAEAAGFSSVAVGPLVRSSYHADELQKAGA